ncbi:MAG: hypothetical protein H0S85_03035 [Desulfovibrionaceae bacterium]|jgi:hypothetical protein|nr:hypothetical protein [Desulfovibrionaceae bacterium]
MKKWFFLLAALALATLLFSGAALAGGGDDDKDSEGNRCSYDMTKDDTDGFYWKIKCKTSSYYCRCKQSITSDDCKKYSNSGTYVGKVRRSDSNAVIEECCGCTM